MLRTGRSGLQDTQWLENMKHTILQIIIILIHVLAVTSVHIPLGCVQTEKSIVLKTCWCWCWPIATTMYKKMKKMKYKQEDPNLSKTSMCLHVY